MNVSQTVGLYIMYISFVMLNVSAAVRCLYIYIYMYIYIPGCLDNHQNIITNESDLSAPTAAAAAACLLGWLAHRGELPRFCFILIIQWEAGTAR